MTRATKLSVAAVLLFALAAPLSLAQVPQPGVTVALDTSSVSLGLSNSTTIQGTVAYSDSAPPVPGSGSTDGTITLSVTVPAGWTAAVEPATAFTLAPGATADFTVTLTAPAAGSDGAAGDATVTADATGAGGRSATAGAPLALSLVVPPPPVVPWYQTPAGIAGIVGAVLLVAAIIGAIVWRNRQQRLAAERAAAEQAAYLDRETGITIALAGGPTQYGHRREIMYRVNVTNASQRPRVALVDVAEVTNGWRAATQVTKLPLSPGETLPVTIVVTPDAVITPGDKATVVVRVKPEEARERDERVTVDVAAPKHGVPQDPNYRIVSVHREGAGSAPVKR